MGILYHIRCVESLYINEQRVMRQQEAWVAQGTMLMLGYFQLITLSSIAAPTECSQIVLGRNTTLRHWYNMVNFEQEVLLVPTRDMALLAFVVVSAQDKPPELWRHKLTLKPRRFAICYLLAEIFCHFLKLFLCECNIERVVIALSRRGVFK